MSLWRQLTRGLRVLVRRDRRGRRTGRRGGALPRGGDRARTSRAACRPPRRGAPPGSRSGAHGRAANRCATAAGRTSSARCSPMSASPARMLRKSPVFTLVVVFVIALGSGAVTTIFSAMNASCCGRCPASPSPIGWCRLRPARARRQRRRAGLLRLPHATCAIARARSTAVAAWGRVSLTIAAGGQGTDRARQHGERQLLRRPRRHGRRSGGSSPPTRTGRPGAHPVIVVSHAFWTARLGAAPDGDRPRSAGQRPAVHGHRRRAAGVPRHLHRAFRRTRGCPLMMQPLLRPRSDLTNASWLWLFGRLRAGRRSRRRAQRAVGAGRRARFVESGAAPRRRDRYAPSASRR